MLLFSGLKKKRDGECNGQVLDTNQFLLLVAFWQSPCFPSLPFACSSRLRVVQNPFSDAFPSTLGVHCQPSIIW